ncbi:hypothetical protein [Nostoc sp. NMS4]|uniref:hypothetical protein n=1 Tax=Nostoc sp. NMS4 TaxID=2815390 RepID=UPI0025F38A7C|nr:hypothetical protein [Nostoc sp. NMS4]MBN3924275.1 hypothetical protein [Nostoc sp. NMS4]
MKFIVYCVLQGVFLLWLIWWGVLALLLPFNEYEGSSIPIPDCDTDVELVAWLSMWVIWLTTIIVVGVSIHLRFWQHLRTLWFINIIAIILSLSSIVRYQELIHYSEQLQQYCQ